MNLILFNETKKNEEEEKEKKKNQMKLNIETKGKIILL